MLGRAVRWIMPPRALRRVSALASIPRRGRSVLPMVLGWRLMCVPAVLWRVVLWTR
jgi:hypothetical protein